MARTKITARLTPDLADTVRRYAVLRDRSLSDIVEDALIRSFADRSEAEHAALVAKLDSVAKRLGAIETCQETLFELTAHAARFVMTVAPAIAENERGPFNARGAERFANVIAAIEARLLAGRSVWRERFAAPPSTPPRAPCSADARPPPDTPVSEAAIG